MRNTTSFHVIRESESAEDLRLRRERAEHRARNSSLRDTFHRPFPASATEYVGRYGIQENVHSVYYKENRNVLSKLPPEVLDLIFSKLSPAALATARYTCRAWWTTIMSNRWILASVLGCGHSLAGGSGPWSEREEVRLRFLQGELDRKQTMCWDYSQPGYWPLRFRQRLMNFTIPQVCNHAQHEHSIANSRFVSADFASAGRFVVLRVANSVGPAVQPKEAHHIIFYQIAYSGEPLYVGSLPCPSSNGFLSMGQVIETRLQTSWNLTMDFDGMGRSYTIVPRDAYANTDAPFDLEEQKTKSSELPGARETKLPNDSSKSLPMLNKSWQILTYLPYTMSDASGRIRHIALAKHNLSATLWVVRLCSSEVSSCPAFGNKYIEDQEVDHHGITKRANVTAVGLIVPPKGQLIYRNIAFTSSTGPPRVAVIWQAHPRDHQYSELYFYDIPSVLLNRTWEEGAAEQQDAHLQRLTDPVLTVLPEHLEVATWFINIHGRRVQSLSWPIGGIDPYSPLWDLSSVKTPRYSLDLLGALGGLQITQSNTRYPREFGLVRKCFIWGPAESDEQCISLMIFDFSFEGSTSTLALFRGDWNPVWQSSMVNPPEYHFTDCACALHDDGYKIVLPNTGCATLITKTASSQKRQSQLTTPTKSIIHNLPSYPQHGTEEYRRKENLLRRQSRALFPRTSLSFPSLFRTIPSSPTPAPGSITHHDPPARKEALERMDEELREHIRQWKKEGKSDFEIAEGWSHSRWSGWGIIAKPEGWREL